MELYAQRQDVLDFHLDDFAGQPEVWNTEEEHPSGNRGRLEHFHVVSEQREIVRAWTSPLIRGEPDHVRAELEALAQRTGADEMMITTMIHGPADRLRSYELVAEAWDLSPEAVSVREAMG